MSGPTTSAKRSRRRTPSTQAGFRSTRGAVNFPGHPRFAVRVEIQRAHQVSRLHRLHERAVRGVHHDAIFLAVADPDVAGSWIDREPVYRAEFSLADFVAVPLRDELAVLVDADH